MEVFAFIFIGLTIVIYLPCYKWKKRREREDDERKFTPYNSSIDLLLLISSALFAIIVFLKILELNYSDNITTFIVGFIFSSLMSLYFVFMYKRAKRKKGKTKKPDKMNELNEEFYLEESLLIEALLIIFYIIVAILFFLKMVGLWELLTK
jgi:hypothetical protein